MVFAKPAKKQAGHSSAQMGLQQTKRKVIWVSMRERWLTEHQHNLLGGLRVEVNGLFCAQ
jgi:hypothetical protein